MRGFFLVILGVAVLSSAYGAETNCKCGWTNAAVNRVVGGGHAGANEFPWIVGVQAPGDYGPFCGGVIITKRHVLTAAHCIADNDYGPMEVRVGEHDVSKESSVRQLIKVKKIIAHEDYNKKGNEERDIAILYLEEDIKFSQKVGPVCMPTEKHQLVRETVKVMGWGLTETNGAHSKILKTVDLEVQPLPICAKAFGPIAVPQTKGKTAHYCTYSEDKDSCQGDSGGPVVWNDPEINAYTTVGVISFGGDCGESPGVNTEVFHYIDWIQDQIKATDSSLHTCQKV